MDAEKAKIVLVYSNGAGQNVRVNKLPEVGETMRALSWDFDRDGCKGTNVAVALGRLGVKCALITRTGDDISADLCEKWLGEAGVDTTYARRDPALPTTTGVVFIDGEGRNTIVLSDSDATVPEDLIDEGLAANEGAEWFITGFEIAEESALYAMKKAKCLGMRTIINASPVPEGHAPDLSSADILVVNEVETAQLLAAKGYAADPDDAPALAQRLREAYGAGAIILTLGNKGYLVAEAGGTTEGKAVGAFGDEVVDTSGAGDGFLAALAYRLAQGEGLAKACEWANAYAGVTVRFSGTIPSYLTLEQLKEYMPI